MWNSLEGVVKKSLDAGIDFVKKTVHDHSPQTAVPLSSNDGVYVSYVLKDLVEAEERNDEEVSIFYVPKKPPLIVEDVKRYFPIPGSVKFRFKIEDSTFDYLWIDNVGLDDDIVPLFKGNVVIQALVVPCGIEDSKAGRPYSVPNGRVVVAALESREELVKKRLEAEAAQVSAAREVFQKNSNEEKQKRDDKLVASNQLGSVMDAWAFTEQGKFKDVRSLLSSVSSVLWPNSGWTDISMGELMMNDASVKRNYRKAIILSHPDKHQSASAEQQYRADRIFNAINESYKQFNT